MHNFEKLLSDNGKRYAPPAAVGKRADLPLTRYSPLKVIVDRVIAFLLLVLTGPLILIAAIAIKLTSRGSVFYSQVRLGKDGKPFTLYKLRTMAHNCESQSGVRWSTPGDPRVTRVGRYLRRTHIDELPQLWNVLRGDMSLVGPRPERPEFVPQLEKSLSRYRERMRVLPGLSGLAQVQLPPDTDLESVRRKLARDLFYVEKHGFWLDFRIISTTGLHVLGLPYSLLDKIFVLPDGERIERSYATTVASMVTETAEAAEKILATAPEQEAVPVPDLQPA